MQLSQVFRFKTFYKFVFIINLHFVLCSLVWAAGLEGGHIIRGIETQKFKLPKEKIQKKVVGNEIKEVKTLYETLSIEGVFALELLNDPEIIAEESKPLEFSIILPNAFIDTDAMPKRIVLPKSSLLKAVSLNEQVKQDATGQITSETVLKFEARQEVTIISEPKRSTISSLKFLVRDSKQEAENTQQFIVTPKTKGMLSHNIEKPKTKIFQNTQQLLLHPISAMMLFQRPTAARISILNASEMRDGAHRLAVFLDRYHNTSFKDRVKMKMKIVNISSARKKIILEKTKIYFRPNYMSAALALAQMIPGEQIVERMSLEDMGRIGIDVDIYVGKNFE